MAILFKMAFRDLGRNRRRTFFSMLALGIGVALLLFMAAMITGEMRGSMNTSIRLQSGNLQVRAKTYDETKTSMAFDDLIAEPDALAAKIAQLEPVKVATPRLYVSGVINTTADSAGVRIVGLDPNSSASDPFKESIVSGEYLTADDREGVLVGEAMAKKLGLAAGDTISIMVNTSDGEIDEQAFVVRGLFNTTYPGFDKTTIFMPLGKAQSITRAEDHASVIFVLLKDNDQTDAVIAALKTEQYQVMNFREMNKIFAETEQMTSSYMVLMYLIVLAITAAVIVNTLIMAVFERTREIGILAGIGMKGSRIMAMFFTESFLLALGGVAIGLLLGLGLVYYAQTVGFFIGDYGVSGFMIGERLYAYLTAKDAVSLTITAFVVTLLAALYPAALAARMEPVEAMRGGKHE